MQSFVLLGEASRPPFLRSGFPCSFHDVIFFTSPVLPVYFPIVPG